MSINDRPAQAQSLFRAETGSVNGLREKAHEDPFTLELFDEMMPGTIGPIRRAAEKWFLIDEEFGITSSGSLAVVASHNLANVKLESLDPKIGNLHVDEFVVRKGPVKNLDRMVEAAGRAMRDEGVPEPLVKKIVDEAKADPELRLQQ